MKKPDSRVGLPGGFLRLDDYCRADRMDRGCDRSSYFLKNFTLLQ